MKSEQKDFDLEALVLRAKAIVWLTLVETNKERFELLKKCPKGSLAYNEILEDIVKYHHEEMRDIQQVCELTDSQEVMQEVSKVLNNR